MRNLAILPLVSLILASLPSSRAVGLDLIAPVPGTIMQRKDSGPSSLMIVGIAGRSSMLWARLVPLTPTGRPIPSPRPWQPVAPESVGRVFWFSMPVPQGWWMVQVRDSRSIASIEPIGVGEVFVVAGQSNAANHGWPPVPPADQRVRIDNFASGTGGNPWGICGDLLARNLQMPIRFINVAESGTAVEQWLPGGDLSPRIRMALELAGPNGVRGILWHQGETDVGLATPSEVYEAQLRALIAATGQRWYVAQASYGPFDLPLEQFFAIASAQRRVVDLVSTFPGPTTDDLIGPIWRYDLIHLNALGLHEHGRRWAETLLPGLPR
ncbi:hypothetical protein BH23PLA1_BH23PLA1_08070 [soil metagenome]